MAFLCVTSVGISIYVLYSIFKFISILHIHIIRKNKRMKYNTNPVNMGLFIDTI